MDNNQSAEELASKIRERAQSLNFESWNQFEDDLNNQIESRDAAQRQAGREEMLKECVELLNAHHKGLDSNGDQIYRIPIKALSDLGKARKG